MRVLIDSNVLISAIYSEGSIPHQAVVKASEPPYHCLVCEQSIEELRRAFNRKFPSRISDLERFMAISMPALELIPIPSSKHPQEHAIRDSADRPIYRAAVQAKVDIIITGDKDFLESGLITPQIMTALEFVNWGH
jgi:putative PIN family toxin of toxin-antitoxin system